MQGQQIVQRTYHCFFERLKTMHRLRSDVVIVFVKREAGSTKFLKCSLYNSPLRRDPVISSRCL